MYQGQFIFSQLISFVPKYEFDKCVDKYNGNYRTKYFKCWAQFLCMLFGQLTYRESISDIINCLKAHKNKVYHFGIKNLVAVSSLTRANESRDWQIYPNPPTDKITIEINNDLMGKIKYILTYNLGKVKKEDIIIKEKGKIIFNKELSGLNAGTYNISFIFNDKQKVNKQLIIK